MTSTFRDVTCSSADGLNLHARDYASARVGATLPVLCLPGLTRTTDDFDVIATALSQDAVAPRRVVAIDYRGRGLSDHDPDPAKYSVPVEAGDVQAVAASLGITKAIMIGTSRGGMIAMVLSATQPAMVAGVVLNDVGPALEMTGLIRIKDYIAKDRIPTSWDEAAAGIKALFGRDFPNLADADWMAWAKRGFVARDGHLVKTHDPALAAAFAGIDPANPPPPAWKLFDKMAGKPLMLIHGGRSDLLSAQGVRDMLDRRPDIDLVEVADEGHAPLLADPPTIGRIAAFCARCDGGG
ncbi:MAG: Hydrolase [Tardiphaga sp.]|nr:Hydrolase [Tardiphaga sp.]